MFVQKKCRMQKCRMSKQETKSVTWGEGRQGKCSGASEQRTRKRKVRLCKSYCSIRTIVMEKIHIPRKHRSQGISISIFCIYIYIYISSRMGGAPNVKYK